MTTATSTTIVVNIRDLEEHYPEWRSDESFVYIGRANLHYNIKQSKWRNKPELLAALPELRGRTLVCHCAPLACEGDILIALLHELETSGAIGQVVRDD